MVDDLIYGKLLDSLYPKSFLMTDEDGLQHEVIHYGDVKNAIEDFRIELKRRVGVSKMENVVAGDTISRQDAIDALDCISGVEEVLRSLPSAQPTNEMLERCKFEYIHACKIVSIPTPDVTGKDKQDAYAVIKALHPIFGDVPFAKVKRGKA